MQPALALTVQLTAALIFAPAALAKLRDLSGFEQVIRAYGLLPHKGVRAAALLLPVIEAGTAAGLIYPQARSASTAVAAILLVSFGVAITVALLRGRTTLQCGCTWSGGASDRIAPWMVVRNFVIALALVASLSADDLQWHPLDLFAVGCAAAACSILYHAMPGLLLQQRARA